MDEEQSVKNRITWMSVKHRINRGEKLMDYTGKILLIRKTLGLSQDALGKRIGLTGAHISRLETGISIAISLSIYGLFFIRVIAMVRWDIGDSTFLI